MGRVIGTTRRSPARWVACVVLVATAVLKLVSLVAHRRFLESPDPVFEIPMWVVLLMAAMTELAVAVAVMLDRLNNGVAGAVVLWFVASSLVYRFVHSLTSSEPCPCLGYFPKLLFWGTQATNAVTLGVLGLLGALAFRLLSNARRDFP